MTPEAAALLAEAEALVAETQRRALRTRGVPARFVDFCAWLGVVLTAGQRVVCLVAYDGVEPRDLPAPDRALARLIFGPVEVIPSRARKVVVEVCGARAGKTYVLEALRLLHLALTVRVALGLGELASVAILEPDKELAKQALNYINGAIEARPELAGLVVARHVGESVTLRRPDGLTVEIVCRAASAKGRTGRGRTLLAAGMGEAAFFRDANYQVNDEEVFRALVVRIPAGGQLIISSTPWACSGLLHDLFAANHPEPSVAGLMVVPKNDGGALAVHAPTLLLRDDDVELRERVQIETERDPDNSEREYGAKFMTSGTSQFFDAAAVARAVDASLTMPLLPRPGDQVSAGGDTGFQRNSSTLAIAHQREGVYTLAELYERKPRQGEVLKPSEVVADFVTVMGRHGCEWFMADGHYQATVLEHLDGTGITFMAAPSAPSEAFVRVNALLREGRVRLPNHAKLLRQLAETLCYPKPGGGVRIVLPSWRTGEHGDLVVAWVLAVYQAYGLETPAPAPKRGTPAWEQAEDERMLQRVAEEAAQEWWER